MKSNWSEENIRKEFLEFQAIYPNVTSLQKEMNSELHRIDNRLSEIYQDDEMNDNYSEKYYELLQKQFSEIFFLYRELYD